MRWYRRRTANPDKASLERQMSDIMRPAHGRAMTPDEDKRYYALHAQYWKIMEDEEAAELGIRRDPHPEFTDDPAEAMENNDRDRERPWNKPEQMEVKETAVLPVDEFIDRASQIGFNAGSRDSMYVSDFKAQEWGKRAPEKARGAYVAYAITNVNAKLDNAWGLNKQYPNFRFEDGWSSSYHDAEWIGSALLYAWADDPQAAQATLAAVVGHLVPAEDPVKQRFVMRNLVRPGD